MTSPTPRTTPTRQKNTQYRSREYLTLAEVNKIIKAAGTRGRHKERDHTLLLVMFRHGLRASEACNLKWDAVMLEENTIWINRLKGSESGSHPLPPDEKSALLELQKLYPGCIYVFASERGASLSVDAIAKIVERATKAAGIPIKVHPHQFRHACGYHLASFGATTRDIQAYLGHKNIQHTVRYTAQNPKRFEHFLWTEEADKFPF
jgi:type 1 fimbriae regulatory protein FimB/type 1 fimbriae regulatory protein FimE